MRKLTIGKAPDNPKMWTFEDSHRPSEFKQWKRANLYHFERLRALKQFAEVWSVVHPNMVVTIKVEDEEMVVQSDSDWAIALLKFGP